MIYHGEILNHELNLSPIQSKLRQQWLNSMKDGVRVKEVLTKEGTAKTVQQIRTIFGMVIALIIEGFNDLGWDSSYLLNTKLPTGIPVTKGLLKEYFYVVCPIEDDEGNRITLSGANITQAMKFIDDTRRWAASQWGMNIPDPDPNWQSKLVGEGR